MATDRKAVLERFFPDLKGHTYRITSPRTNRYNCVAWANGVATKWWQPMPGYYWPASVPTDGTADSYIKLFALCDFAPCGDGFLEAGVEKIAVFSDGYAFRHVARQLADGKWTSKLGSLEDIEHESPDVLCGDEYGNVVAFMKRDRGSRFAGNHP